MGEFDYVGWGEIAQALGVCQDTARAWSRDSDCPLPVYRYKMWVVGFEREFCEWRKRQLVRVEPRLKTFVMD